MKDPPRQASRDGPQRGQTMAEYALVMSVITISVVAALSAFGNPVLIGIQRVADLVAGLV